MRNILLIAALLLSTGATVLAQNTAPAGPASATLISRGARLLLDRPAGLGRIDIRCAEGESTKECVDSFLPIISGGQFHVGIGATTSLKCGDTTFQVST